LLAGDGPANGLTRRVINGNLRLNQPGKVYEDEDQQ
jgi:hypothetical protein